MKPNPGQAMYCMDILCVLKYLNDQCAVRTITNCAALKIGCFMVTVKTSGNGFMGEDKTKLTMVLKLFTVIGDTAILFNFTFIYKQIMVYGKGYERFQFIATITNVN